MVPSLQIVNFESSYAITFKDLINNNYGKANIFMYKTIKSFRAIQELLAVYTPFTFISFTGGTALLIFCIMEHEIYLKCLFTQARGKKENIFPNVLSL